MGRRFIYAKELANPKQQKQVQNILENILREKHGVGTAWENNVLNLPYKPLPQQYCTAMNKSRQYSINHVWDILSLLDYILQTFEFFMIFKIFERSIECVKNHLQRTFPNKTFVQNTLLLCVEPKSSGFSKINVSQVAIVVRH